MPKSLQSISVLVIFLTLFGKMNAQDPEFSQFYANPLYLNPAYAGTTLNPKFHINFRDQWPAFSHAYVSYSASYDQYFEGIDGGIGILFLGDVAGGGIYNTFTISGMYSYQLDLSDYMALKIGLQASYVQKQLDFNKLFFYDQIDPVTGFYDAGNNLNPTTETSPYAPTIQYADFSAGILGYSEYIFAGVSVKHLNRPIEAFTNDYNAALPMRYTVHAGALIPLGSGRDEITMGPNFMYTQQAKFRQLNAGSYFKFGNFFTGAWYRYNISYSDAVILLVGVQTGILKTGYSYDYSISDLQGKSGGSHEISIVLNFDDLDGINNSRMLGKSLQCPPLF